MGKYLMQITSIKKLDCIIFFGLFWKLVPNFFLDKFYTIWHEYPFNHFTFGTPLLMSYAAWGWYFHTCVMHKMGKNSNNRWYICMIPYLYSDEIIQLLVKLKFIKKKHVNGMRVDIYNKIYVLPSLFQAFSLTLAWIRPSLNTFLQVLHHGTRP